MIFCKKDIQNETTDATSLTWKATKFLMSVRRSRSDWLTADEEAGRLLPLPASEGKNNES